jgi:hypothetical protein
MIQSIYEPAIILTDHTVTQGITTQISLVTTDTGHSNIRLVHISHYLSQFDLDICYITGRMNIVPNTLSRLPALEPVNVSQDNKLDNIWLLSEALMTDTFCTEL